MKKSQKTFRALVGSIVSLIMCVSMFTGSTYAWFTDKATAGVNTIKSGTLEVTLVNSAGDSLEGQQLAFKNANNDTNILWEPGCTYSLDPVYVKNDGNLAIKYRIVINGIDGSDKLLEAITWSVDIGTEEGVNLSEFTSNLLPNGTSDAIVLSGHMREDAGKEYQNLSVSGVGITVYATQYTSEYDSNNNQYDAAATLDFVTAKTAADLTKAVSNGGTVSVTDSITTPERISVLSNTTIQGNGNTIAANTNDNRVVDVAGTTEPTTLSISDVTLDASSAKVDNALPRGISLYGNTDVSVDIDNSTVKSSWYAINVAGSNESVTIDAKDTTLEAWGAVNIWSPTTLTSEDCTIIGNNDKSYNSDGWNNFGTIVVNAGATNTSLSFKNCRIEANATTGNQQWIVLLKEQGVHLTFTNCTFVVNGTEINAQAMLSNYFAATSQAVIDSTVLTIDGEVISLS